MASLEIRRRWTEDILCLQAWRGLTSSSSHWVPANQVCPPSTLLKQKTFMDALAWKWANTKGSSVYSFDSLFASARHRLPFWFCTCLSRLDLEIVHHPNASFAICSSPRTVITTTVRVIPALLISPIHRHSKVHKLLSGQFQRDSDRAKMLCDSRKISSTCPGDRLVVPGKKK